MSLKERMAALQNAANAVFKKTEPEAKFSVGELVSCGNGERGVVASVLKASNLDGVTYEYAVRGAKGQNRKKKALAPEVTGRHAWFPEHELVVLSVTPSSFALDELPVPVLGLVLGQMSPGDAALAATASKKFLRAFREEATAWRARCRVAYRGAIALEDAFEAAHCSWLNFFRLHCCFHIRIVTIFGHRGGTSLSGDFTVAVDPDMPVKDFFALVKNDPRNHQRGQPNLSGFDPKVIRRRNYLGQEEDTVQPKPEEVSKTTRRCHPDWTKATLREAGLFDQAELAQPEEMMRD
jgi:hypothetical protein